VDIPGIWVDHVLVSAHKQQCASIFTNRTGKIESVYIGRRTSDRYLRLYQKGPLKKVEEVLIRVEYQTRDAGSLDKIDQMKNPFANLKLYHITEPDMPAETAWFIDSARQRGVRRALSIVPKAAQKPLQDFLLAHQAPWWNPAQLWGHWQADALAIIFSLPTATGSSDSSEGQGFQSAA
jgi:hypothetical protein